MYSNIFLYVLLILFFSGCGVRQDFNGNHEVEIMDFITSQKEKLPKQVDINTDWVDIKTESNKIIYVYKLRMDYVSKNDILRIKNYYNYGRKNIEICNLVNNIFDGDIIYEYLYLNSSNKFIFKVDFSKKNCSF